MDQTLIEIERLYELYKKANNSELIIIGRLFLGFSLLYLNGLEMVFDFQFKNIKRLLNQHNENCFLNDEQISFTVQFLKEYPDYLIKMEDDKVVNSLSEIIELLYSAILPNKELQMEPTENISIKFSNQQNDELFARLEECDNNEYEIAEIEEKIQILKMENNNNDIIIELNKQLDELIKYDYHSVLKELEQSKKQIVNQQASSKSKDTFLEVNNKSVRGYMTLSNYCKSRFRMTRKDSYSLVRQWLVNQKIIQNESFGAHYIYKSTKLGNEIGVITKVRVAKTTSKKTTAIFLTKNAQNYISKYFKELEVV